MISQAELWLHGNQQTYNRKRERVNGNELTLRPLAKTRPTGVSCIPSFVLYHQHLDVSQLRLFSSLFIHTWCLSHCYSTLSFANLRPPVMDDRVQENTRHEEENVHTTRCKEGIINITKVSTRVSLELFPNTTMISIVHIYCRRFPSHEQFPIKSYTFPHSIIDSFFLAFSISVFILILINLDVNLLLIFD